jgi:hypothetical protein
MAGWRVGVRAALWVGKSSDLYCEVCRGAEDAGFDLDLVDILVIFACCCLFSWGKGLEVVTERKTSGTCVL